MDLAEILLKNELRPGLPRDRFSEWAILGISPPTPRPNWQAPVSTRKWPPTMEHAVEGNKGPVLSPLVL